MSVSGNLDQNDFFEEDLDLLDALLSDDVRVKEPAIATQAVNKGPLSFQQERLWFLSELDPDAAAYTIFNAFRLQGQLDEKALFAALETLVERHEALRTAICSQDGQAQQIIMPVYMPVQNSVDLTQTEGEAAEQALHKLLRSEAARPFVLSDGKPFRVVLAKLAAGEHALMLSLHHIISDAWSMTVLMGELAVIYHAYARGEEPLLPRRSLRYIDYALWQRGSTAAKDRENREMAYWLQELEGLPLLELPTDFPRPQKQTFNGATVSFQLPATTTRALQKLSASERTTLFSLLMAALHVLMARHARQSDVAIGTSIAGRDDQALEGLIGFFANMVVIRARLEQDPSFRTLLRTTAAKVHAAMDHSTLAYDRLVEGMKIVRDPSRNPIFQVAMTLLNLPDSRMSLGTLAAEKLLSQEAARFDLELFLSESDGILSGTFVYNTDLFLPASLNRLSEQWLILLADIAASPDKPVSQLALINDSAALLPFPRQTSPAAVRPLHERIVQQAEKWPDRRALQLGNERLTYGELASQARQIAHALIAAGINTEQPVGLWFEPGFGMIAAMLGTWMAGGGYMPVDIHSPAERIATIIEDSEVKFMLSDSAHSGTIPIFAGTLLCIDEIDNPPQCDLPEVSPERLAYIIYTSGSTGRPKGVEVTHANAARLFSSCDSLFEFESSDVWTFFHSYAFDFSVWEIWGALVHGASLLIVPPIVARSTDSFYDLLCDQKVTVLSQTPSAFRQLMAAEEANPREGDLALRYVVFGGEALDIASLASWMDRHGDEEPRLVNMYGITEITVHATFRLITYADLPRAASSVIGTPLPDLCLRLLDPNGEPVPEGMVGEIFVGGAGVARGYRNQPALTAARFLRDASGMPLYRSGDLARINAWGELEYRGRADSQIKLRGYRIETGEIENTLRRHPAIEDAVVAVRGQSDAARLVAWVRKRPTSLPQGGATAEDWRPSFDMIYAAEVEDDDLDVVGWNDSYDNKPLPLEHMRLWRDEILQRLRALQPTRVLELGTGSGMLLLPLAEEVERYQGLDFSAEAVARLSRKVAGRGFTHVQLEQREASDQAGLPNDFDLAILNSIAQYFPKASYFIDVLDQAMQRLNASGSLFVGDLRHLGLLRHFHASRLVHRRPAESDRASLLAQLTKMVEGEKELLVDPAFFFHWAAQRDDIARIDILPKVGGGQNELTTYRYDVAIVKGTPQPSQPCERTDVANIHAAWQGQPAFISGIPNPRLAAVDAFLGWLESDADAAPTSQQWKNWSSAEAGQAPGVLAEQWQSRAGAAKLYWTVEGQPGHFELAVATCIEALPALAPSVTIDAELTQFFNVPSKLREEEPLATTLRRYLAAYLPDYMLPAVYIPLETFPLTLNGKLNYSALPEPEEVQEVTADRHQHFNDTERKVAKIWTEVLQLAQPELHANFFEKGGHSLLATQVISRLNAAFSVKLPLRSLFDHPTIAGLAAMLESLLKKTGQSLPPSADLKAVPRGGLLPLAYTQQRFWFMEQIDRGSIGSHNISLALRLRGQLVPAALRAAIQTVVARHEALRTVFVQNEGEPAQLIKSGWTPETEETDLSHLSPSEAEKALRERIAVQANTRFKLDVAPPLRLNLVRLSEQEHVLQLTLHHAICDGWSLGVMVREFSECYAASVAGRAPQLPALPLQLADFAVWQRTELAGARLQSLLQQWKQRLLGAPYGLSLPFDRVPPSDVPKMGQIIYFNFEAAQLRQLKHFAESQGATLFMVLTAGYSALLSRYSGTYDVVIGTPIAQRQHKELEGIVGCFLNTLALRIQSDAGISGRALLAHVRERVLEAYEWQDAPFDAVVSELSPERSRDRHALFQTMLTLQNMPLGKFTLPGLEAEPLQGEEGVAGFDLSVTFIESADDNGQSGLQGMLEYDANKFLHASVERFSTQLHSLLLAMATTPETPVATLNLLAPGEREHLLEALNETDHAIPHERCLHELIALQAARTPDSIAVRDATGEISYAELEARANAVAWTLHEHGVGPDSIVGLCTERDRGMVIGLLGIMKAGAAYLPLDPDYPAGRLDLILNDARPAVLVTQSGLTSTTSFSGPKILLEDLGLADPCPASGVMPANLAYIIYTSGSTGVPKGVMITHAAIVNYLSWALETYTPGSEGTVLMSPSYAFDGSMTTLFTPLISGRCMQLMLRDEVLSRTRYALLARSEQLALIDCGPAQLDVLQQVLEPEQLASSRVEAIVIGGEALQASTVEQWRRHAPSTRLYNEYGPTEATVGCCTYQITAASPWFGPMPVGRGIWNVRVYVLDEQMQPVPPGIAGDLYVAGSGLARGYAGKPGLTAQSFIPDPFSEGGRLYRTGDRASWSTTGVINYLGRNDDQVKFRGFRIELGEIEEKIRQYPGVTEAAVRVHTDDRGNNSLVAYLAEQHDGLTHDLAAWLRERLPGFMVPSHYVRLAALPISVSGKVDRNALPLPDNIGNSETEKRETRALNAIEQRLATIWREVTGHAVNDPEADFFEAGGDSLRAVKLIFLIEREFKRALPLASLFGLRTLEAQAVAITAEVNTPTDVLVPIHVRENAPSVVLVHDISGQILSYRLLAEQLKAFGVYAIQSLAAQHENAPSIARMAELYARAIVEANIPGPLILAGHSFGAQVATELARTLTAQGKPPLLLAILDGIAEPDRASLDQLPRDDLELMDYMIRTIELSIEKRIDLDATRLRALPEAERAGWITAKITEAGVVPEQTSPEHVMQLFTIYKNNLESLHGYQPGRVTCPVALWSTEALYPQGEAGWGNYADRVTVQLASGDHVSMLKPPHVQGLAASLAQAINDEMPS